MRHKSQPAIELSKKKTRNLYENCVFSYPVLILAYRSLFILQKEKFLNVLLPLSHSISSQIAAKKYPRKINTDNYFSFPSNK